MDAQMRFWFNEDLESRNYIVPGLIALIMTVVGALLTSLTVVRELEQGSMEGLLATPLKKTELLLGKLGPYFFIGMLDMGIVMAMGKFLFQVPLRGSPLLLIGLSALFLIATLGQGLLISVSAESQLQAFQMAILTTFLPSFLLSGFVFAIYLMPLPLRIVSYIVPARYLVTISKGIYLKGLGLGVLWPSALMLTGAASLFVLLAIRKFVKKIHLKLSAFSYQRSAKSKRPKAKANERLNGPMCLVRFSGKKTKGGHCPPSRRQAGNPAPPRLPGPSRSLARPRAFPSGSLGTRMLSMLTSSHQKAES